MKQSNQVRTIIFQTLKRQKTLSFGILAAVIGAIVTDLLPPLILGKIIDTITAVFHIRMHQWFDPPPGHLCFMDRIEQLRCAGRLHRQLDKT